MRGVMTVVLLVSLAGCGADADGDGFRAAIDCDDHDATIFPGALERCDGVDEDCDGQVDQGAFDGVFVWLDTDGDLAGDPAQPRWVCALQPGQAINPSDCDDSDKGRHPGALERCDGVDEDCDGSVDEDAVDLQTFYADRDGDGAGDDTTPVLACEQPLWASASGGDCDDHDGQSYPGAVELCDALDRDCDGDPVAGAADPGTWHADTDEDGFGDPDAPLQACEAPSGHVADATDCDDGRARIHPGADETCDGYDEDCDGLVDEEARDATLWFTDVDEDGFGGPSGAVLACSAPPGTAANLTDCDDTNPAISPARTEVCDDGADNDCSGLVDDCELPSALRADEAEILLDGRPGGLHAGYSVSSGADVDGDGRDDLLVGEQAPHGDTPGDAWLVYGLPASGELDLVGALTAGEGEDAGRFGEQVALVGDLDGDGYADAMVSAPRDGHGTVHLRYGGPTRWAPGVQGDWDAHWQLGSPSPDNASYAMMGAGLSGLGDLDGDGLSEAGFAAPYEGDDEGHAFVLPGSPTRWSGTLAAEDLPAIIGQPDDHLGEDRGMAGGDLDGDGLSDVAIGANGAGLDGVVYLLYSDGALPTSDIPAAALPLVREVLPSASDFGRVVSIPADLDGDGHLDLVVGDPRNSRLASTAGAVWVFAGGPVRISGVADVSVASLEIRGSVASGRTGASIAAADFDEDGIAELAVGSIQEGGSPGEVGLFSNRAGILRHDDADLRITGEAGSSQLGVSLATGDLDGDGQPELVIGADRFGADDGRVYVFLGSSL
jgi:hypothetical protein